MQMSFGVKKKTCTYILHLDTRVFRVWMTVSQLHIHFYFSLRNDNNDNPMQRYIALVHNNNNNTQRVNNIISLRVYYVKFN